MADPINSIERQQTRQPTQMDSARTQRLQPPDTARVQAATDGVGEKRVQAAASDTTRTQTGAGDRYRPQTEAARQSSEKRQATRDKRAQSRDATTRERTRKADALRQRQGVGRPTGTPNNGPHVVRGRPDPGKPDRVVDRNVGRDHATRKQALQAEDGRAGRGRVERSKLEAKPKAHTKLHMHPKKEPSATARRVNVHNNAPSKGMPKSKNPTRISRFRRAAKGALKVLGKAAGRVLGGAWSLIPMPVIYQQMGLGPKNEA